MAIELTREVFDIDIQRKYYREQSKLGLDFFTAEMLNPTIGFDCELAIDTFQQPYVRAGLETFANTILRLIFCRPGQFPSQPWLGMDIEEYLFGFFDEISESELKDKIVSQCDRLGIFVQNDMVSITKLFVGDNPVLVFQLSSSRRDKNFDPNLDQVINIGISFDRMKQLVTSIEYADKSMM